jgi:hypothetical protein
MGLIINNINSNIENGEWTMLFTTVSPNFFSLESVKATFTRIENIYNCSVLLNANIDFSSSNYAVFTFSLPFNKGWFTGINFFIIFFRFLSFFHLPDLSKSYH